jgi:hypothetical protein
MVKGRSLPDGPENCKKLLKKWERFGENAHKTKIFRNT